MTKRLMIGLTALGALGAIALWALRPGRPHPPASVPPAAEPVRPSAAITPPARPDDPGAGEKEAAGPGPRIPAAEIPAVPESKPELPDPLRQTMAALLSPQTGLQQKRALWMQVRQEGHLDQVIAELERQSADNPSAPEFPTALGEAYLNKTETVQDSRDRAILGLEADQSFDKALQLDPNDWEAGFYKTAALARWPDNLNKGAEVIQRFTDLLQRQEAMTPRPEFAATYVLLGEQYQKAGQPDSARQVWLRGASLFPNSPSLRAKLTPGP